MDMLKDKNNASINSNYPSERKPSVTGWFNSGKCNYKGRPVLEATDKTHRHIFRSYIEPYIGTLAINDVTEEDCYNIINKMKAENAGLGTQYGTYAVLTRIFRSALDNNWIEVEDYPCRGLKRFIYQTRNSDHKNRENYHNDL